MTDPLLATLLGSGWGYEHHLLTPTAGPQLAVVRLPHLHRVSLACWLRAGSRYEPPCDNGLSHMVEHMMFRGTADHPSPFDINLAVEDLGGTLDAATSPDVTEFELTLPVETLDAGIGLFAEILSRPAFTDLEVERKVIVEELQEDYTEDGVNIDLDLLSRQRLWPDHPLGQGVAGPLDNVRRFGLDDVRRHHRRTYVAGNAVIGVAGPVDPDRVAPLIERAFAPFAEGPGLDAGPAPIPGPGPTIRHATRAGSQSTLRVAFPAPGLGDPDHAALEVLLNVLDDGMSTRLHRRVFDERGLAYNVSADMESYEDAGGFDLEASSSHENVPAIAEEFLALVANLRDGPLDDRELAKARRRLVFSLAGQLDEPRAMGSWFAEQALFGRHEPPEDHARQVMAVGREDLRRVAARVFTAGGLHVTTVGSLPARELTRLERIVGRFA